MRANVGIHAERPTVTAVSFKLRLSKAGRSLLTRTNNLSVAGNMVEQLVGPDERFLEGVGVLKP